MNLAALIDKLIAALPAELQQKARESRKAIVSGLGALLTALTLLNRFSFLVPAQYKKQITVAISFLTTIMTYLTPNDRPAG